MSWQATTQYLYFNVNTIIAIYENGQSPDHKKSVPNGVDIDLELAHSNWIKLKEVERNGQSIIVSYENKLYELTPLRDDELGLNMTMSGMHFEQWVVRKEI